MTPEQLQLINDTLPEIQANTDAFAHHFYEGWFALAPETRVLVKGDMVKQGRALVDEFVRLAASVCTLDDFVCRAHELGVRNRGLGATREHYEMVEQALNTAFEAVLGDRWDPPTAQAWHRLYRLMAETMLEGSAGVAFVAPRG